MLLPNRHGNSSDYRYGFNGMELDNEVKGEGNSYDYKNRLFDPRVGKFFSTDLLTANYPMLSPYQFASNRPIDGFDVDGNEWAVKTTQSQSQDGSELTITNEFVVKVKVENKSAVITAPNVIKAKAELIKKAVENKYSGEIVETDKLGKITRFKYKTTVVLDYTPQGPNDDKSIGHLVFVDKKSKVTGTTTSTKVTTIGGKTTRTTTTVTASSVTAGDNRGQINFFSANVGLTIDGSQVSDADLENTAMHEFGHSASLNHPWELSKLEQSLSPELDQSNTVTGKQATILSNLMNSDENPLKANQSTNGSTLLKGQIETMVKNIETESYYSNDELKPKPKGNN